MIDGVDAGVTGAGASSGMATGARDGTGGLLGAGNSAGSGVGTGAGGGAVEVGAGAGAGKAAGGGLEGAGESGTMLEHALRAALMHSAAKPNFNGGGGSMALVMAEQTGWVAGRTQNAAHLPASKRRRGAAMRV